MSLNKNKEDMNNTANQIQQTRATMEQFRPQYAQQRQDIANFTSNSLEPFRQKIAAWQTAPRTDTAEARTALGRATGDTGTARDFYTGMLTDPSKRGYGADTVNQMYAKQADVATGAARGTRQALDREAAAGGMSNTGAVMRNAMTANEKLSSDLLGANRDVNLANAQASREDLWNAAKGVESTGAAEGNIASGYGTIQGLEDRFNQTAYGMEGDTLNAEQNALNQELASLQGEQGLFNTEVSSYNPQITAYEQKNKPGFWGNFGNAFSGALGKSLGSVGYSGSGGVTLGP